MLTSKQYKSHKVTNKTNSAALRQEPISNNLILDQAKVSALSLVSQGSLIFTVSYASWAAAFPVLRQVECVQLRDLPGSTLQTLDSCRRLQAISLVHCGVTRIDSLDNSTKLLFAHLKVLITQPAADRGSIRLRSCFYYSTPTCHRVCHRVCLAECDHLFFRTMPSKGCSWPVPPSPIWIYQATTWRAWGDLRPASTWDTWTCLITK